MNNSNIYKGNNEAKLSEIMNDDLTVDMMNSDKVTSDDLIQIIMSAKNKIVSSPNTF